MWYVKCDTDTDNAQNSNLSSFNRIKRSSLVRSNDAVETFKCHVQYEESATQTWHPGEHDPDVAVPELTGHSLEMYKDK